MKNLIIIFTLTFIVTNVYARGDLCTCVEEGTHNLIIQTDDGHIHNDEFNDPVKVISTENTSGNLEDLIGSRTYCHDWDFPKFCYYGGGDMLVLVDQVKNSAGENILKGRYLTQDGNVRRAYIIMCYRDAL